MLKSKSNKKIATKREKLAAKDLKGKTHAASGSYWHSKGDASNQNFLIDDKFTKAQKYSISLTTLQQLESQAKKHGKIAVLKFGFENRYGGEYAVTAVENYVDPLPITTWSVASKSRSFNCVELKEDAWSSNSIIIGILKFVSHKRAFVILRWDDFIENQRNFCLF